MLNTNILGRLGADAEVKESASGSKFMTMRVATDEYNRQTKTTDTVWVNVACFGEREINSMSQHLKKGSAVFVQGILRCRIFDKQDGTKAIGYDLTADRIEFAGLGASGATQTEAATTNVEPTDVTCGTLKKTTKKAPSIPTPDDTEELPF